MVNDILIDEELSKPIVEWVLGNYNNKNVFDDFPDHPTGFVVGLEYIESKKPFLSKNGFPYDNYLKIRKQIVKGFGFKDNLPIEENMGFIIVYSEKGHRVHPHRDTNFNSEGPGWRENMHLDNEFIGDVIHTRFNVLISKPIKGGNPIIDNIKYEVKENEAWVCFSGVKEHQTDETEGDKPRILLSFGHWVPKQELIDRGIYKPEEI
jgi:hypothetical protein